ncbi:MAG: MFS transporter [Paracoccaceae bacterium]
MQEKTNWPMVWLLWLAGLGAAAQYGKISVVFDRLPGLYPDAGAALGFVVSLVGFLGILLGVIAGLLVARIGYRRALLAALIVGAAVSAVQATLPSLPVFLTSRVIEGASHLAIVVAAPTLIAEVSHPRDAGRSLTLWGSFFGVAFAVLAFAGVPLADWFGVGALLAAHGAYMAIMAVILWPRLPQLVQEPQPIVISELLRAHVRIYSSARLGAPALGWLFYTACFVSVLTVFPPYLPEASRTAVMGAMPLLSIVSSLTLGVFLLRYVSAVIVVVAGFFLSALFALGLGIWPGSPIIALALGASLGLVQGATFASVPQLTPEAENRALANGGLAQMGNTGNTIGTPLMVAVIALLGYSGLIWALTVLFLCGGAIHLWLAGKRRQE